MYKFEKLKVWQHSVVYIERCYLLIRTLPKEEDRNLSDQLRRSVTSVSLNIAEGSGAENDLEYKRYLSIAKKSLSESIAILKIIERLYKLDIKNQLDTAEEIGKMLSGLVKYLKDMKHSP